MTSQVDCVASAMVGCSVISGDKFGAAQSIDVCVCTAVMQHSVSSNCMAVLKFYTLTHIIYFLPTPLADLN